MDAKNAIIKKKYVVTGTAEERDGFPAAIRERARVDTADLSEILDDLNFSHGFTVSLFHSNSSHGAVAGSLTYDGKKPDGKSVWQLSQWGCTHNMVNAEFLRNNNVLTYDDGGKNISVDVSGTGAVTLGIKGSKEYTKDASGNVRERTEPSENWPHILIEQKVGQNISDCSGLFMEIEYTVTKCESMVNRAVYPENDNINSAQFQWFITLTNDDENSCTYGNSMWFGFSMFDSRYIGRVPPGLAAYDGGKEDSTGLFIYMPSLVSATLYPENEVVLPTSVKGKKIKLKVDILPFLKEAISTAQSYGALEGASVEKLKIGSTNIGWEIPGNNDVEVKITYMNMYKTFSK